MIVMHKVELVQIGLSALGISETVVVADNLKTAVELAKSGNHTVAIVEPLHYPSATEKLSDTLPVVVLTASTSDKDVLLAIKAGASAYLHVSVSLDRLRATLKAVETGSLMLNPSQATIVMRELENLRCDGKVLNSRQIEILELVVDGNSNPAIAKKTGMSVASVAKVLWGIYETLEVTGGGPGVARVKASVIAVKLGLV